MQAEYRPYKRWLPFVSLSFYIAIAFFLKKRLTFNKHFELDNPLLH